MFPGSHDATTMHWLELFPTTATGSGHSFDVRFHARCDDKQTSCKTWGPGCYTTPPPKAPKLKSLFLAEIFVLILRCDAYSTVLTLNKVYLP